MRKKIGQLCRTERAIITGTMGIANYLRFKT